MLSTQQGPRDRVDGTGGGGERRQDALVRRAVSGSRVVARERQAALARPLAIQIGWFSSSFCTPACIFIECLPVLLGATVDAMTNGSTQPPRAAATRRAATTRNGLK